MHPVFLCAWRGGEPGERAGSGREEGGSGPAAVPRVGRPDVAPCAGREPRQAVGGARRRPCKTLSVCYLPSHARGGEPPRAMGCGSAREGRGDRARDSKPRTAAVSHRGRCSAAARVASRHGRIHRALPQRGTGGAHATGHGRGALGGEEPDRIENIRQEHNRSGEASDVFFPDWNEKEQGGEQKERAIDQERRNLGRFEVDWRESR